MSLSDATTILAIFKKVGKMSFIDQVVANWSVEPPLTYTLLQGGTNSRVWRIVDGCQQSYVLRLIAATARTRSTYALTLLQRLQAASLPWLLPVPLPANTGELLVPWRDERAGPVFATLTAFLPGDPPFQGTVANAQQGGAALAKLDTVLASITLPTPSEIVPYGDLAHRYPGVADPLSALANLPGSVAERERLHGLLEQVMADVPHLYRSLPQQIIHGDFDRSNVLMNDGSITAILDFDIAGPDLRLLDLVVALSWWPTPVLDTEEAWPMLDALGRAYHAILPLTASEVMAIVQVMRLRDVTSFIHRCGRYLAGEESPERMEARIRHSLWREDWLTRYGERLQSLAFSWLL